MKKEKFPQDEKFHLTMASKTIRGKVFGSTPCVVYFGGTNIDGFAVLAGEEKWISSREDCIAWLTVRGLSTVEADLLLDCGEAADTIRRHKSPLCAPYRRCLLFCDIAWDTEGQTDVEDLLPVNVLVVNAPNDWDTQENADRVSDRLREVYGFQYKGQGEIKEIEYETESSQKPGELRKIARWHKLQGIMEHP